MAAHRLKHEACKVEVPLRILVRAAGPAVSTAGPWPTAVVRVNIRFLFHLSSQHLVDEQSCPPS